MTLLARGIYGYWRDGVVQAVTEPWSLLRVADGLLLQGQRWVGGELLLEGEAGYREDRCQWLRVRLPSTALQAHYRMRGPQLHWTLNRNNAGECALERQDSLAPGSLLFPLLRAATGCLLPQLVDQPCCVVVPWLRDPSDKEQLLRPLKSTRSATRVETQAGGLAHWRYVGGEYGDGGADCWVDRHGLMQRYCWDSPSGRWEVRLTEQWTFDDNPLYR